MWLQVLHTLDQVAGAPLHENGRPDGWDEDLEIGLQAHEINLDFIRNGPPAAADEDEDAYGPPPPPPHPTPAPTMAPTPPNFAAFAENLLTAYDGDQQAAHTAFAALLGALDLVDNVTPTTPDEPEPEEPKPDPEPEPTVPDPPLAILPPSPPPAPRLPKKKKRCRNQPKKGSTNGLCSVHQPKDDDLGANSDAAAGPAASAGPSDNESEPGEQPTQEHEFVAKLDQFLQKTLPGTLCSSATGTFVCAASLSPSRRQSLGVTTIYTTMRHTLAQPN